MPPLLMFTASLSECKQSTERHRRSDKGAKKLLRLGIHIGHPRFFNQISCVHHLSTLLLNLLNLAYAEAFLIFNC
ncbi:hypothetical protein ANCDUO_17107 [Ancylostoma duodenale]|uniref:Uncharacterized protein n=1 Tax=Ancylostoma duodenale TaxID=51022 RepID=A0A0C2FW34_9BILA|nr:hypothetical protein ANCDUO_17107 [Ancylostoma duodenale]